MLEFGADPTTMPNPLDKPLDAAVREQPMVLIEKLIECGAIISDRTMMIAEMSTRPELIKYLERVRRCTEQGTGMSKGKRVETGGKKCVLL